MKGFFAVPLVIACGAAAERCGPTPAEEGQMVLMLAPIVVLLAAAIQWGLLRLWRTRVPTLRLTWTPTLIIAVALVPGALLSGVSGGNHKELDLAFWLFGTTYLAVLLATTRLWLAVDRDRSFFAPQLATAILLIAPAVPMALGWIDKGRAADVVEQLWIFPGYGGWVTGGIVLALIAEHIWRVRSSRGK